MKCRILSRTLPWLSFLVFLCTQAETTIGSLTENRGIFGWRGGVWGTKSETDTTTTTSKGQCAVSVEAHVAATRQQENQGLPVDRDKEKDDLDETEASKDESSGEASSPPDAASTDAPAVVGVKTHHHKKSNAVGDPDGGDDDDDSDEGLTDFSDEWEELEEFEEFVEDVVLEPELQVEVELVEESGAEETDEESKPSGGGGVGVRLGRMNKGRRRNSWRSHSSSSKMSHDQQRLLEAWVPHVFFPPTESALSYLTENARLLDAGSKNRLDRRTLYACLLMEWGSIATKLGSGKRKFLPPSVSQTLQAALSMATQPQWRQSAPRTSGIRLYQDDENTARAATLSMQETIAMALVRVYIL